MGGNTSKDIQKNIMDQLNETISNTIINNRTYITTRTNNDQTVIVTVEGGSSIGDLDINMSSQTGISASVDDKTSFIEDIQSKLKGELESKVTDTTDGLGKLLANINIGSSTIKESETRSNFINRVVSNINEDFVKEFLNEINNKQKIEITVKDKSSINRAYIEQNIFNTAVQEASTTLDLQKKITSDISAKSSSTVDFSTYGPIGLGASGASSGSSCLIIILAIIAIFVFRTVTK